MSDAATVADAGSRSDTAGPDIGWLGIARLGLVQAALGSVVVLTTSTLNRVMVVELALPALLPGLLVALHYAVQVARPRMGHGSDVGGRRTPWIVGGMGVLALGGFAAALATVWMATAPLPGMLLAALAFALIGLGVSACGTSLLVLLAKRVEASRQASAATIVWLMMIVGFALTAGIAGKLLEPYSPARLLAVSAAVSTLALLVTVLAMVRLEPGGTGRRRSVVGPIGSEGASATPAASDAVPGDTSTPTFAAALREVWADAAARRFAVFVFVAMLAYSAQDLILEPFAGTVYGMTPGQSTQLSGLQHGGVLLGMLAATLAGRGREGRRFGSLRAWQIGGCLASALALLGLALLGLASSAGLAIAAWPLGATVVALGAANGAFSIAAIASMMRLAGAGGPGREGIRMGLWGAAQAIAFGAGGLIGTGASDVSRWLVAAPGLAYGAVFLLEALLFVAAALLAAGVAGARAALPEDRRPGPRRWTHRTTRTT